MKKLAFLAMAVSAMMLTACGGQTSQSAEATDSDTVAAESFEQSQIEEKILVELDSVAAQWNKLNPVEGVFANGKIKLSDDEVKVKPEYLLDPESITDLTTNAQKYRALGMFTVDMKIAELYKMDEGTYKAAITKLSADVSDPALKVASTSEDVEAFYQAEKKNGRINLFWQASAGVVIENLYVISQNSDKLLAAFDDETAADMTFHITTLMDALNRLGAYDTDIKELSEIIAPVNELNAMDVAQLKDQISKMKPQIEEARAQLLK